MKTILLSIAICFALTGCFGHTEVRVIEQTTMVVASVDPIYLEDCKMEAPTPTAEFVAMGTDERTDALVRTLSAQYKHTKACTVDKQQLRTLLAKQQAIIDERNQAEAKRVADYKAKETK